MANKEEYLPVKGSGGDPMSTFPIDDQIRSGEKSDQGQRGAGSQAGQDGQAPEEQRGRE